MLNSKTRRITMLTLFGLLPGALLFGEHVSVKQIQLEKEGTELIGQLEDVARDIHYNADQLEALTRQPLVSRWTHYHHLHAIRSLVNDGLRPALARLTEIQRELPPWKQDAIDKMLSSAVALAADTNSALLSKNENRSLPVVLNTEYREFISKINDHAQALVKTSSAAEDLAMAHLKADQAGLEISRR